MAEARQKSSKDKGGHSQAAPDDVESKRLRDRAVNKGSLARAKASPAESLPASKGRSNGMLSCLLSYATSLKHCEYLHCKS